MATYVEDLDPSVYQTSSSVFITYTPSSFLPPLFFIDSKHMQLNIFLSKHPPPLHQDKLVAE